MTAPVMPLSAAPSSDSQADALETIVSRTMEQTAPELVVKPEAAKPAVPAAERQRDAKGQFLPVDIIAETQAGTGTVKPIEPVPALEVATEDDDTVPIPEGYVAPTLLPEERAKGFKVFDAEGEIAPPDLSFEFTLKGKQQKVPIDKVISYAQMGIYNHQREQLVAETETKAQGWQQRASSSEKTLAERDAQIERLLSDPDYLIRTLTEYEQQNTPDAKFKREQAKLHQDREDLELSQHAQRADVFIERELEPALDAIANALPTVSRDELAARLMLAADPYRRKGVLMPEGYDPVSKYVVNDLIPWAKQVHEHRDSERRTAVTETEKAKADAKKEIEKAQVRTARVKRLATGPLKPTGRAMPDSAPVKPVRTGKDAEARVIGDTLAALRATG